MNQKQDILNTWILLEQLNEGDIQLKDEMLVSHDPSMNMYDELSLFLQQQNEKYKQQLLEQAKYQNNEDALNKKLKRSGLALYFDIFSTNLVTEKLKTFFQIPYSMTDDEFNHTTKFSLAIYFDHNFTYYPDNTFHTFASFLKELDALPEGPAQACAKYESEFLPYLSALFNEDPKNALAVLCEKYHVTEKNFRFKFLEDIRYDDTNLHSFFIQDLKNALSSNNPKLLRYLEQTASERRNLDTTLENSNWHDLHYILQPKFYPCGRFPSNSKYALSLMQQVAVNLILNANEQMSSVNGPPGTGKTTLLKDVFAEFAVKQAHLISEKYDKELNRTISYYANAKMAKLPAAIANYNVIVASSNNGAVQNIVKELPKVEQIDDDFIDLARQVNYFPKVMLTQKEKEEWEKSGQSLESLPYWGAMAIQGGASENIKHLKNALSEVIHELETTYHPDASIYQTFSQAYQEVEKIKNNAQRTASCYSERQKNQKSQLAHKTAYQKNNDELSANLQNCQQELNNIIQHREWLDSKLINTARLMPKKPNLLHRLFNTRRFQSFVSASDEAQKEILEITENIAHFKQEETRLTELQNNYMMRANALEQNYHTQISKLEYEFNQIKHIILRSSFKPLDTQQDYANIQRQNPWFDAEFRKKQSELFLLSFAVRKQFLYDNLKSVKGALNVLKNAWKNENEKERVYQTQSAWEWINFIFPVLSTTFASFQRMFHDVGEDGLANLFIDEAGQALPQAAVGAIMRCKKVVALGDPEQLKPVLPLPINVLNPLKNHYQVDNTFVGYDVSVQKLIDTISRFGFYRNKEDGDWIGIPLWVHRRCQDPMFSICNQISYNNLMVIGEEKIGKAKWLQVSGEANNKFVVEQAEYVYAEIEKRIALNPDIKKDIYIITPFRHVANRLRTYFHDLNTDKNNRIQIGTVHTFQGKEAKIVFLVLGASENEKGAANWVNSEPNLINVAVSRAKEEFYIVGDKSLYCKDSDAPLTIAQKLIDQYNL